jgi:hypothetical protein
MPLPSEIVNQITRRAFISTELVEIEMPSPIYVTTAPFNIYQQTMTSNGFKTYLAQGNFLSFSGINTVDSIRVNSIQLVFSGATNLYVNMILNDNYLHRPIRIYKQFMEQNATLNRVTQYVKPVLIYEGVMTGGSVEEDGKQSTVNINTNNQFYDFDRKNGRRTNDASQQRWVPGDRGMEYSTATIADIVWGKTRT